MSDETTKTGPMATWEFHEESTGVVVKLTIPFPVSPKDTQVYQVLKSMCEQGFLRSGAMRFHGCGSLGDAVNDDMEALDGFLEGARGKELN